MCNINNTYWCDNSIRLLSATYDEGEYVQLLQPSEQSIAPDDPLNTAFQHVTHHQLCWNWRDNGGTCRSQYLNSAITCDDIYYLALQSPGIFALQD